MLQLESLATRLNAGCFSIDGADDLCNLQDAVAGVSTRRVATFWQGLNSRQQNNFYFVVTKVCDMDTAKNIGSYTWMRDTFKAQYSTLIEENKSLLATVEEIDLQNGRQQIELDQNAKEIAALNYELSQQDIEIIRMKREIEALKAQLADVDAFKQSLRTFLA